MKQLIIFAHGLTSKCQKNSPQLSSIQFVFIYLRGENKHFSLKIARRGLESGEFINKLARIEIFGNQFIIFDYI